MVSKTVGFGMPALALTDHGYLFRFQILTLHAVSTMRRLKTLASGVMMWSVLKRVGI